MRSRTRCARSTRAIIAAGFLLQIDDPFLVSYYIMRPDLDVAACRKWAHARVEALNHALAGIPEDRIRFHTCYSINMGPRVHDMELKDVVDIILKVRAGAYSFEAANPRHEHEWKVWKDAKLPDDKILIPGVITQSTVLVEHPEACRRAAHSFRRRGRPRTRDRRRRLRLCILRRLERGASEHHLGEVQGARRGRATREQAAVVITAAPAPRPSPPARRRPDPS